MPHPSPDVYKQNAGLRSTVDDLKAKVAQKRSKKGKGGKVGSGLPTTDAKPSAFENPVYDDGTGYLDVTSNTSN